jgi:hypothetical protein
MKSIVFLIGLIIMTATADLATVRQKYILAKDSAKETEELYTLLEKMPDDSADNTMIAYKAASLTLRAKHEKGLLNKKKLFTQGVKLLEAVVKRDANNYEVRVLRLGIQENAPKITGYNKDIQNDKAFLIKNYSTQKADLKAFTFGFIKISKLFTKEEKSAF